MDWMTGIQRAIDYIEEHITEDIDREAVAGESFSSYYHFQRVFSILCGYTLGEYIRLRRLSLAGAELANGSIKVIDAALKYGYDSPESFSKAFRSFHGLTPSEARRNGSKLRSFSRLSIKITLEGGSIMNYRIEEKPELILTGFKAHFTGAPYGKDREEQEGRLFTTTRGIQWFLHGASHDSDPHCVIDNITDEGYDFYYCHPLAQWTRENLYNRDVTGVDFIESMGLETVVVPKMTYIIFETKDTDDPITDYMGLLNQRVQVLTEWLPEMGFRLAPAPELAVYHWVPKSERNVQVWLPVEKIK